MIKVLLLFPPHFSVFQPYLALPVLTSFLRNSGIYVTQKDLNLDSFYYFMNVQYLESCIGQLKNQFIDLEKQKTLSRSTQKRYETLMKLLVAAPTLISNIESSLAFFKDTKGFPNFEEYQFHERIIQKSMQVISAVHYSTNISLTEFSMKYSPESSQEILRAVADDLTNPYIKYFSELVQTGLTDGNYQLIGISLTAMSQVIPGLTLAHAIRQHCPDTKIVLGGSIATQFSERIKHAHSLFSLFDYLIKGEGETPLLKLCEYINGDIPLDNVPNLLSARNGSVCESPLCSIEDVNSLPAPDFDGFLLEEYLSPLSVLSVEPARGCFWRKCTFCNQYLVHGKTYRPRKPQFIIDHISKLKEKYGASLFNISNEGVPLSHLKEIAQEIVKSNLNIKWYAGAHLGNSITKETAKTLKKAGCQKLILGLESGSPRILTLMKKGINLKRIPQQIKNISEGGIDVHLYLMIGFPTESYEEMDLTRNFVLSILPVTNKEGFSFYISVFQLMIESPLCEDITKLGFKKATKGKKYDLEYTIPYAGIDQTCQVHDRQMLEGLARQISKQIYANMPIQTIPNELTHYMCYKDIEVKSSRRVPKKDSQSNSYEAGLTFSIDKFVIKKNPLVSSLKVKFPVDACYYEDGVVILYNIFTDKYYSINKVALDLVTCLDSKRLQESSSYEPRMFYWEELEADAQEYIGYLIKEGLVSVVKEETNETKNRNCIRN